MRLFKCSPAIQTSNVRGGKEITSENRSVNKTNDISRTEQTLKGARCHAHTHSRAFYLPSFLSLPFSFFLYPSISLSLSFSLSSNLFNDLDKFSSMNNKYIALVVNLLNSSLSRQRSFQLIENGPSKYLPTKINSDQRFNSNVLLSHRKFSFPLSPHPSLLFSCSLLSVLLLT